MSVAVLMTCYNRCAVTLACLEELARCIRLASREYEVFLVDDGSSDGTSERVAALFPWVRLIRGGGDLYWCGGMRLAWQSATEAGAHEAYLWLNDDVRLAEVALKELEALSLSYPRAILAGACADADTGLTSYGFLGREGLVSPCSPPARLTMAQAMNGNCVWVPRAVYERIGSLHAAYRHSRGDSDYGWRALKAGLEVLLTPFFVGTCSRHDTVQPKWMRPGIPLRERWRDYCSPKGVPFREYWTLSLLRFPVLGACAAIKWPWLFLQAVVRSRVAPVRTGQEAAR